MIVVIGSPSGRLVDGVIRAGGMVSRIALAAAAAGQPVQLVGRTGDDATADAVVIDLGRGGVGHVALLRDPARPTPLEPLADATRDLERPDDDADTPAATDTTAGRPTVDVLDLEPADVDLGLRYLTEFAVIVLLFELAGPNLVPTVTEAASWGDAKLIVVVGAGDPVPVGLPTNAVVIESPETDPDGAFATLVGTFAAGLGGGAAPGDAFRRSIEVDGWSEAPAPEAEP